MPRSRAIKPRLLGELKGGISNRNAHSTQKGHYTSSKPCRPGKLYLLSERLAGRRDHWRRLRGNGFDFALRKPESHRNGTARATARVVAVRAGRLDCY